ncbi:MAG: pitrilysin family protein [Bacteroidota bacterium]
MQIAFEQFTLENGLRVIVHEDHTIPKAVVNVLYRVGSKDESPEKTGFAHLFEHLMFRGSKHIPNYDRPLQQVGGQNNAFTSCDITNYYLTVPSNQLETGFWLESDRMLGLDFTQENLEAEKSVVIEEFKQRYLNQPYGDAYMKLRGLHFDVHPYQWATIGKEISHIEEATMDDVQQFFYGFYAPNNATLVVAGDVTVPQVRDLAEKWFGPIPHRQLNKKPLPVEPPQTKVKTHTTTGPVPFPAVYKMYHIPGLTEDAYYAADILTDIMASGKGSLLQQHIVRNKQLSPNASAFTWGMYEPGALSVDGRLAPSVEIETYEAALEEVYAQLHATTEEALERVKGKIKAVMVMRNTTILNKAMGLARGDAMGTPNLVNEMAGKYERITLAEMQKAAETYLRPENSSTLYYLPQN